MTTVTRNPTLDRMALGSDCHRCRAVADTPCRTPSGRVTNPHDGRLTRAVSQYLTAKEGTPCPTQSEPSPSSQ